MKLLLGNVTKRQLKAAAENAGSYLFIGPEGVGKYTTAQQLSAKLGAKAGSLIVIEPEKSSLKIEQVQALQQQLQLKTLGSQPRVVIVRDAHLLTREAQNAFLKTLEEPPTDTTIILTAAQTDSLAATILSRCQKISFPLLEHETIAEYLSSEHGIRSQQAKELAVVSEGAVGVALRLHLEPETLEVLQARQSLAEEFLKVSLYERLVLNQQIVQDNAGVILLKILNIIRGHVRSDASAARQSAQLLATGEALLRYLKGNGNAKLAMDRMAIEFER